LPVVIINGLTAILFMIGYVFFGVAMIKTTTLPHWLQSADAYGAEQHTAAIASIRAATARN
jgi:hypothetical protein